MLQLQSNMAPKQSFVPAYSCNLTNDRAYSCNFNMAPKQSFVPAYSCNITNDRAYSCNFNMAPKQWFMLALGPPRPWMTPAAAIVSSQWLE